MCWHELTRCCCCLKIRSGVFLIAGVHIAILAIVMAESIVQFGYPDEELLQLLFSKLRLQDSMKHIILMACIVSTGIFCNFLLLIAALFSNSLLMLPALLFNFTAVLALLILSGFLAGSFWKSRFNFYSCVIPIFASVILLYFWIVICVHFKDIRRGFKTGPSDSRLLPEVEVDDESGLRTRSRTGYELESVDEINNSDRRYLYATTFDTADGMSPMPAFHISPSSTPDVRSLQ